MKHPARLRASLCCAASLSLAACGGGAADPAGAGSGKSDTPAETGVLIDSPVAGIGYRTATQSGVTDANGRYDYLPGETVTFFVGNVTLPPVTARGTVTPFDLANSTDSNHPIAINVASFLQSLDADANPANGISIPAGAAALATGGIDFNVPNSLFSQNANLINLVRDANPGGRSPVDAATARAHLLQSMAGLDASARPNLAPIASAAASASAVSTGQSVTFSGAQSEDPNGDPLSYRWTLTTRPEGSQAVLSGADAEQATFTADVAGTYAVSLVVSDGSLDSAAATADVVVADPPPPPPPQVTLTGLSIGQAPAKIAVGGTQALTATAGYSDSSTAVVTTQATWTSSAPGTLAVDETTGALSGVAAGTAQISASYEGVTAGPVTVEVVALDSPVVLPSVSGVGQFTAHWTPVTDAESYRIYLSEGTPGVTTASTAIDDVATGELVDGLTPGTAVFYRVGAVLGNHVQLSAETSAYVYDNGQPSGTFQATAAPQLGWSGPSAVRLDDGRVLIMGQVLADPQPVELYDPAANTFTRVASPSGHVWKDGAATLLASGKVLYTGGADHSGVGDPSAETYLFDPATDTLIAGPALPWATKYHTATRLRDGRVLIAGGLGAGGVLDQTALYDPVTNTFTAGPNLLVPREYHAAHLLHDGRVLIAAGVNMTVDHTSSEIYDPATNTITPAGTMVDGGMGRASVMLADGRVLFAGGEQHPRAEVYDPASGTFSSVGSMAAIRHWAPATRLPDGSVLIAGGDDGGGDFLSSAERFDPVTNQFSPTGSIPYNPGAIPRAPVLLQDGRVFEVNFSVSFTYGP